MSDHNEAMRLADRISPETDWYEFDQVTWCNEAAALIRKQAERIAELERLSTGLSTVYNEAMASLRIVVDERDTLRAEVERLRVDSVPLGAIRGVAVEAIRDVIGCPDVSNDGKHLSDTMEETARHATYAAIAARTTHKETE